MDHTIANVLPFRITILDSHRIPIYIEFTIIPTPFIYITIIWKSYFIPLNSPIGCHILSISHSRERSVFIKDPYSDKNTRSLFKYLCKLRRLVFYLRNLAFGARSTVEASTPCSQLIILTSFHLSGEADTGSLRGDTITTPT